MSDNHDKDPKSDDASTHDGSEDLDGANDPTDPHLLKDAKQETGDGGGEVGLPGMSVVGDGVVLSVGDGGVQSAIPPVSGDDSTQKRTRALTTKGLEFTRETKLRDFSSAVSRWRGTAAKADGSITSADNVDLLKAWRESLEVAFAAVQDSYHVLSPLLGDTEMTDIRKKFDTTEESNLALLTSLTEKIRDVQHETVTNRSMRSRSSRHSRSSRSSSRTHASSTSSKHAEAAAKVAALNAKLKYMDLEARQRAELEQTQTKMQLEMASAELKAFEDVLDQDINRSTTVLDPGAKPFIPKSSSRNDDYEDADKEQQSVDIPTHQGYPLEKLVGIPSLESLKEQLLVSRLPLPEPGIFTGDPLAFPSWIMAFDTLISSRGIPPMEQIHYLRRYLGGDAKEAVEGYLLLPTEDAYREARLLLKKRYGDPFTVAGAFRDKLEAWPRVVPKDGLGLRKYADYLRQCVTAMSSNTSLAVLNDERENQKMLAKLPDWLVSRWARLVADHRLKHHSFPPFCRFAEFIEREADIACDPVIAPQISRSAAVPARSQNKPQERRQAGSFKTGTTELNYTKCNFCDLDNHALDVCRKFMQKSCDERKEFIQKARLCYGCLSDEHLANRCRSRSTCRTCQKRHPTCLHGDIKPEASAQAENDKEIKDAKGEGSDTGKVKVNCGFSTVRSSSKSSLILPVRVSHSSDPSQEVCAYAMLDTQSDTTFVSSSICDVLGVKGTRVPLSLSTMSASNETVMSKRMEGLIVRGLDETKRISLPAAYTRDVMPVDRTHIPTPDTARQWPHLQHIANHLSPELNCEVGLLIGYDCPQALAPRDVVSHKDTSPYAQRTDLGWGIVGISHPTELHNDVIGVSHHILARPFPEDYAGPMMAHIVLQSRVREVKGLKEGKSVQERALKILESDFNENDYISTESYSQHDLQFLSIMEGGIHRIRSGHYEMPLPGTAAGKLPNNKTMAVLRLKHLQKKLLRSEEYLQHYTSFMADMLDKGYAEKAPPITENDEVWYVPHHGVYHPRKPGKLRVVFDCSAVYKGTSLNSQLLQGPDLTNKLVGVLCRFRQEPIAVTCDIKAMFHQFSVNPEDRNLLRFLWWENGDLSKEPTELRMTVHLFGAASSPACANYGLRTLAAEFEAKHGKEAAQFVMRSFYVDDGVTSLPTEDEVLHLVKISKAMCDEGGLTLHKFASNSRRVLAAIPPESRASTAESVDLFSDPLTSEHVLGVHWCVDSNTLGFRIELDDKPSTRRGILSTVSSIYDPLGMVAPMLLVGKQILQDTCQESAGWDMPLPAELQTRWEKWRGELVHLRKVEVPRCYKPPTFGRAVTMELHHFADASSKGYGACSYLRQINERGQVHVALVMGKSRVAPRKTMTIPRLELTAAVTAIKLSQLLRAEVDYQNMAHHFWSDSKVALGYIYNEASRFHVFVANRVQSIRNHSDATQWHYVPTEQNPADLASRGCCAQDLLRSSSWFSGPQMLWEPNLDLVQGPSDLQPDDPEVRRQVRATTARVDPILTCLGRFSSWTKMLRVVAVCLRFISCMKARVAGTKRKAAKAGTFDVSELMAAKTTVVKSVQHSQFSIDITSLTQSGVVTLSSSLSKLDPFVDDKGLLRVGGRIRHSALPFDLKHPLLLPKAHHVTLAILHHFHERSAHQGRGMTLSTLRENGFWVIGASKSIARIISQCVKCRKSRGMTSDQKMADLPKDRLETAAPFTHTGMDYFGPFYIKEGRKELKRWGCIFTCLASRAIHLEVAPTLSTDTFLNALRRFLSIRGNVTTLRCDNGTNFVGANNELQKALSEVDDQPIRRYLAEMTCEFRFNPPHASHMGGVWERQIRTVRSILSALPADCGSQLDDDSLRTLMAETAAIVNSRPLSTESLSDPTSLAPISPNRLLTMKSSAVVPPPGEFQRADLYSRKRWRRVQYLANIFWSRWKKEYIHQLQQRQKWSRPRRNFISGDVVLLMDDSLPRSQWKLGRVLEAKLCPDGSTRQAKVIVGDPTLDKKGRRQGSVSVLERPTQKMVLLLEAMEGRPSKPKGKHV